MNYKKIAAFLFITAIAVNAYPVEKWNIAVADWQDLSAKKDKSVSLTIKKSITLALQKEINFQVVDNKKSEGPVADFTHAIQAGRDNKADVIIYGSYYVEGESLIVNTEVFDVLERQLKMRKYYTGKVTADIFETIDAMAQDMVVKIKEVLPAFTEESGLQIKKIRQTVYQPQEVSVKRIFYTHMGVFTDVGPRDLADNLSQTPIYYKGTIPLVEIGFGFTFRLWDFRLDLSISGMPGIPVYDGRLNQVILYAGIPKLLFFNIGYYLPVLNNSISIGIGAHSIDKITAITTNNDKVYNVGDTGSFPLSVNIFWNPYPFWELGFSMTVIYNSDYTSAENNSRKVTEAAFPPFSLSTIYFFGNFGIEAQLHLELNGLYTQYDRSGNNWLEHTRSSYTVIGLYFGMVYKVDFINQ